jgi:hypothetical protein
MTMLSTLLIAAFTFVLFVYWLRHNCLLILKQHFPRDHAPEVAAANNLRLPEIRQRLQARPRVADLPNLYRQLMRDHRILTSLVRYTATFQGGTYTVEQRLLAVDFRVMQFMFLACQAAAPKQARRALAEAARVLEYFANVIGERAVSASAR